MRKLIALLLALALVMGLLAACSGKDPGESSVPDSTGSDPTTEPTTEPTADPTEPQYEITSVADILAMKLEDGEETTDRYYIRATVVSIDNANYGAMTVQDDTGSVYVYGTYSEDGSIGYAEMTEKPFKNDEVLLWCTIKNFQGKIEIHNARLISFTPAVIDVDQSDYTDMTIAAARDAAVGTAVKVDGVVARITYANGQIPAGLILVDETNSIYVYDSDLAGRVKVGNRITILASKTYWILDSESSNAAKFGYKGCNQLESAVLLENDGKTDNEFDKRWIPESTVKEILDTPVSQDITTTIFKVNALVSKVPGNGFTNYYIDDLDGETGSYVYTQCNGGDFGWLDAFDGKICTVYLTVLNAKSTTSDCVYRFLPVAVIDEGFDPASVNVAQHVVKYYGIGQFLSSYTGNPALELLTSVSSDLLDFRDAKLSYSSSDPSIISIDGNVMNCKKTGTATVTVKGSYNGKEYSEKVTISVTITQQAVSYPTVADAIGAAVDSEVTVKGVVGPSLVNQSGFYLIDDTGVIAVLTDKDTLATLQIGNEVVLKGIRTHKVIDGSGYFGQTLISGATVVTNNYGKHAYSIKTFITGKTLADINNLDNSVDHTTEVYVLKGTVKIVETKYYKNIYLVDGDIERILYCSSANQYGFLKDFEGQEVTVEYAPCDWNSKGYKGCVLSVILPDGSKVINSLNFD
ncbi:MAG: hypothetical protein PUB93_07145 [Firmicutes bacterium]|nr:hypothetical protein [Bacillota bacterium]